MVLESIFNPENAENHPKYMFLFGFILTIIAAFLSLWVFPAYSSLVFVFLTTIAGVPLIYRTIKLEEKKDLEDHNEVFLLKEHGKALRFFMLFFIGVTLAIALLYVILPGSIIDNLFESQLLTLNTINPSSQVALTGNVSNKFMTFQNILFNNLNVTTFCILFSFLYGVGALFILIWNASVIGVAIGNFIRSNIAMFAHLVGLEKIAAYFKVISIGLFKYAIHGIPEILAYFTAGLAGGIISVAVIKHNFSTRKFEHVVLDSADLILISIGLVILAAVLEVYLTPLIF
jgi:uncharacterized membrane protein SpoIIM required for sporulation